MNKIFLSLLFFLGFAFTIQAQRGENVEELAEQVAEKAERVALNIERLAEKNAVKFESLANQFAADIERKWDRSDIRIRMKDPKVDGDGNGAFLGIYLEIISEEKARKLGFDNVHGSYVTGVIKNTAADKAGIQPFDYIYGIDEYRVGPEQNLGGILRKYEPGDEAMIHFYRKGKAMAKSAVFGSPQEAKKIKRNKCEDPFFGIIQMSGNDEDGVKVKPVKNSTAMELGLQEGDVITHINGYRMIDWDDISIAIDMMQPGETIKVDFLRQGNKMNASHPITSYAEAKNCKDCDCDDVERIIIDIDPDIDISFRRDRDRDRNNTAPRVDVADVEIAMENVTESEADDMQTRGVDFTVDNTLDLKRLELTPDAQLGMFHLSFNLPSEGNTLVKVYNPVGRIIYEYDLGPFSGKFEDHVDISQNGPGTYYLQVTQNNKVFVKKIVLTNS